MMRDQYNNILKNFFQQKVFQSRIDLDISQEEMGHRLLMSCRSYVDLEHQKFGCSALTLALYLTYLCPDRESFLNELQEAFDSIEIRRKAV